MSNKEYRISKGLLLLLRSKFLVRYSLLNGGDVSRMNIQHTTTLYKGLIAGFSLLFWPSYAFAHLVTTGLGPVYDGIGHLVMTPEDLIPVLALAIFAGLRGPALGRRALFVLPLAWFVGGLFGVIIEGLPTVPVSAISFLILGVLVAADLKLSQKSVTIIVIGVGFVHGLFNGVALKEGAGVLGLIGIMVTLFVIVAIASAFIISLKQPWTRIVVRVSGSWVAAMGMLMFGWMFRGQG
jgi:urease accessory protein